MITMNGRIVRAMVKQATEIVEMSFLHPSRLLHIEIVTGKKGPFSAPMLTG